MDEIKTIAEARESLARLVELTTQGYQDALSLQADITTFVARARRLEAVADAARVVWAGSYEGAHSGQVDSFDLRVLGQALNVLDAENG